MKKFRAWFLMTLSCLYLSCAQESRADPASIPPDLNMDGYWKRGESSIIRIKNFTAEIIGSNGVSIEGRVEYFSNDNTILVSERDHSPEFIANYVPYRVAEIIYTNELVADTRFRLRKSTADTVDVQIFAWQIYYDTAQQIYMVTPYTGITTWSKITNKE